MAFGRIVSHISDMVPDCRPEVKNYKFDLKLFGEIDPEVRCSLVTQHDFGLTSAFV